MDKISVIMPVYNGERYLKEALTSVLSSGYENLELVIVDDGSTDRSAEICCRMRQEDKRIVLLHQDNHGVAAARNRGLLAATGEWITFCDQDDVVEPDIYSKLHDKAVQDGSDVAICGMNRLTGTEKVPFEVLDDAVVEYGQIPAQLLYPMLFDGYRIDDVCQDKGFLLGACIWKCLISRELLRQNRITFHRFIRYEDDRTFLMEILCAARRVSLLRDCLYNWRFNQGSETYRRRFIDHMPVKMQRYSRYESRLLDERKIDEAVKELYFRCERCNNMIQLVSNEDGEENTRTLFQKARYLRKAIYTEDFGNVIAERKRLKKNIIRRRTILFLLSCHMPMAALLFQKSFMRVKKILLKSPVITKLEKKRG